MSYSNPVELLLPHDVSTRLKNCKKPKSMISRDIFPKLVNRYHDFLAIPLTKIYNQVLATGKWPSIWQEEIVTVIPKNENPQEHGDCRNIACTPLYSKVLELIMMDRIHAEIPEDHSQYGGTKKVGTEHFFFQSC